MYGTTVRFVKESEKNEDEKCTKKKKVKIIH